jgi:hypothetical protein
MVVHVFRAAVMDGAHRPISAAWQFLSHDDEIDITVMDIASQFKASLHSSGLYRLGFTTNEQAERFRPSGLDKAVYKWSPAPFGKSGARIPFQILIPAMGLGTNSNYRAKPDVRPLKAPDGNEALVLNLIETTAPGAAAGLLDDGAELLHEWSTPGGRHISIATHLYKPTPTHLLQWRQLIASNHEFDMPQERCVDEKGEFDPRGLWHVGTDDETCQVLDAGTRELAMWATFTNEDT